MTPIRAVNTAPDSENRIHADATAAAYGFRGGLVPGVTVYGYLAAAAVEHFGAEWLSHGAMDLRLKQPVYDGDELAISVRPDSEGRIRIDAGEYASGAAWIGGGQFSAPAAVEDPPVARRPASAEALAPGTVLGAIERRIDLATSRISAPLPASLGGMAHPAVLLSLANEIFMENYILGPWLHGASEVRKFRAVRDGETVRVRARIEDRFERNGHEFAILDVTMSAPESVERVRHTAIWRPRFTK